MVAYLDDFSIVGDLASGADEFRQLCTNSNGVCSTGLEVNPAK